MPLPLLLAAVPSAVKGVNSIFGLAKGNKAAKANKFPIEKANPLLEQNLAIAEQMAQSGLPQQQYNQAKQGFQRNQAGALRQFGRMGNPRGLAGIVRAGNDSTLGLNVAGAQARLGNQRQAMGYRSQLANEQNRVFDWNSRQNYIQKANAIAQQIGSNKQNGMNSLSELSQLGQLAFGGGTFGQGGQGGGGFWSVFGNKNPMSQGFTNQYANGWSNGGN